VNALALVDHITDPYRVLCVRSNTKKWLRLRKRGVGASESAAILGETGWGTALTVWRDKTAPGIVDHTNTLMEMGHYAEPMIQRYMEAHPERFAFIGTIHKSEGLLQSIAWPWLLGTLDRRVLTPQGFYVPLEMKSVGDHAAREWMIVDDSGDEDPFGLTLGRGARIVVPKKYQVQVQQQIAITGAPFGYVAVWLGKERIEVVRVDRDDEFIEKMLVGVIGDFWRFNVEANVPPAPVLGDDLWALWPGERGETIEATDDVLEEVFLWRRAGVDAKEAKDDRAARALTIASFMGNATELVNEDGDVVHTLRPQAGRRTVDMDKLEAEFPEAFAATIRRGSDFRVHRPTKTTIEVDA